LRAELRFFKRRQDLPPEMDFSADVDVSISLGASDEFRFVNPTGVHDNLSVVPGDPVSSHDFIIIGGFSPKGEGLSSTIPLDKAKLGRHERRRRQRRALRKLTSSVSHPLSGRVWQAQRSILFYKCALPDHVVSVKTGKYFRSGAWVGFFFTC